MRLLASSILASTIMTTGCLYGNANSQDSSGDLPIENNQVESFSQAKLFEKDSIVFKPGMDGWLNFQGNFHYDAIGGFSYLQFSIYHKDLASGDEYFSGRPLKFQNSGTALATPFNIASLGSDYDTKEAPIYLIHEGRIQQVGKFRKVADLDSVEDQLEKLHSPTLCEGAFAEVCSISVALDDRQADDKSFRLQLTLNDSTSIEASINYQGFYSRSYYHDLTN
ncbi:MAG: hypothetical protein HRU19_24610 [Pseudobacteriovorax sp.]|nr:hypothetical protein [Pseudobacteriovorax sp.]